MVKHFIQLKNTEKYCDIEYYKDEATCKKICANSSYYKKRNTIERIKFYGNNYQRRLMQIKKSNDEQIKITFENWKNLPEKKLRNLIIIII